MIYTIKNDRLKVEVNSHGAELHSIQTTDKWEYLWQGNPDIWEEQAPNLFPYIGRLTDETYTLEGREYHMKLHGFIKEQELTAERATKNQITFRYDSSECSRVQYPFEFSYLISYELEDQVLHITNLVENHDSRQMYFGIGGHPGFRVPLEEHLKFEDYALEFSNPAHPSRIVFTEDGHVSGQQPVYYLEDDRRIPLRHELFDNDAIVLKHMDHCVTIGSDKGTRAVKVTVPDYTYLGFWHRDKMAAPYVCVEPWSSLPSRYGVIEDLSQQSDLISLAPGKTYENHWKIEII